MLKTSQLMTAASAVVIVQIEGIVSLTPPEVGNFRPIAQVPVIYDGHLFSVRTARKQLDFVGDQASLLRAIWPLLNGFKDISDISAADLGFRPEVVSAAVRDLYKLGVVADARTQFWQFHDLSKNPSIFAADLSDQQVMELTKSPRRPVKSGEILALCHADTALSAMAKGRRSCRDFSGEGISLEILGMLCEASYSIEHRSVPSAGGLYPLCVFVIAQSDGDHLPQGYYEYDPQRHELVRFCSDLDAEQLAYCFNAVGKPYGSPVQIVIAADLTRQPTKYADRGYRFTLLEAGAVAQNITINAHSLGLATCELGSFVDDALRLELNLEEHTQPLIAIAVGRPRNGELSDGDHPDIARLYKALVGDQLPVLRVGVSDIGCEGSVFGAYAVYAGNEIDTVSGATSTRLEEAKALAVIEGYERVRSGIQRIDHCATGDSLTGIEKLLPHQIYPYQPSEFIRLGLAEYSSRHLNEWVVGRRHDGEPVIMPADLVYYPYSPPNGRALYCRANSSGVAAHTDFSEAQNRAMLELIERDALMNAWLSQTGPKRVTHASLPLHERKRVEYWAKHARAVHFLDISCHNVPIMMCVIIGDSMPFFVAGAAARIDGYESAFRKSFREAEFALMSNIRRGHEEHVELENVRFVKDHSALHRDRSYCESLSWLVTGPQGPVQELDRTTLNELRQRLGVIVVDLSEAHNQIKVVRCLSESLLPITFGTGSIPSAHPAVRVPIHVDGLRLPHFFA